MGSLLALRSCAHLRNVLLLDIPKFSPRCGDLEEGLESWFGGFAVGADGFEVVEAGFFEHGGEVGPGEAEPAVGVELTGFLEVVLEENRGR